MKDAHRSGCPINLALEVFGDRWTLLVIRDLMFAGKRSFREFLDSEEHIASNVLSDRLKRLVEHGLVTAHDDPEHRQKTLYRLTARGIDLLPVLLQMASWSVDHMPVDPTLTGLAISWRDGGAPVLRRLEAELRKAHLGARSARRS
jgi:DNA-binding HxlR family transcriptional regulator